MKNIHDEGLRQPARFAGVPFIDRSFCDQQIAWVLTKLDANLPVFRETFPAPASQNLIYPAIGNIEWTSSFWTGLLWLAYEISGDAKYREAAESQLPGYQRRITERIETATHDLGFLYSLSCVAAANLTADQQAEATAVQAAELLTERYFERAGIIQAWGDLNDPEQRGRLIIDCCMNLPLLYWAARVTGARRYYEIAYHHACQAANYLVREDASTYHTFYMDVATGAPRFGKTAQGYSDASCWARGQAWAIYGFGLSYRYTRDWRFITLAQKVAHYFLNRLPDDYICYWDLSFTTGPEERDSSAMAIAACGLLELAKHLPLCEPHRTAYENAALRFIRSLAADYTTAGIPHSNGLLQHAVYSKPAGAGVDECNIWGDYFYLEALVRLVKDWQPYW